MFGHVARHRQSEFSVVAGVFPPTAAVRMAACASVGMSARFANERLLWVESERQRDIRADIRTSCAHRNMNVS